LALAPLEWLLGNDANLDPGGSYDDVGLAAAMGGDELDVWFLSQTADPFFQAR
jgi:hypothetical protein